MQGNPTPVKRVAAKGARPKAKKALKPNYIPGYKVISEKYMRLTIKALHLQNFLNANINE